MPAEVSAVVGEIEGMTTMKHDPVAVILQRLMDAGNQPQENGKGVEVVNDVLLSDIIRSECEFLCRVCSVENNVKVTHEWTHIGICPLCQEPHVLFNIIRE